MGAATIFDLAGLPPRIDFDGTPMPFTAAAMKSAACSPRHDHVAIEYWGIGAGEGAYARTGVNDSFTLFPNNTYKAMRIVSPQYDLQYTVWCSNEHELYDMKTDPHQTRNLYGTSAEVNGHSMQRLVTRLDALLMVLKSCKGEQCTMPWLTLHPSGNVNNLAQALDPKLDDFYSSQDRVAFTDCALGYIISAEGPMQVDPYYLGD